MNFVKERPHRWSPVLKGLITGALTGSILTLLTYFASARIDTMLPCAVAFGPPGLVVEALHLPIRYWGSEFFNVENPGLIFAVVFNALLLSVIGALAGWLWRKLCKP